MSGLRAEQVRPLADNLLVKPIVETRTASGLYIPEVAHPKRARTATVLALGPGKVIAEEGLKVGDVVAVEDFVGSGTQIIVEGHGTCVLFGVDEVEAVLEP